MRARSRSAPGFVAPPLLSAAHGPSARRDWGSRSRRRRAAGTGDPAVAAVEPAFFSPSQVIADWQTRQTSQFRFERFFAAQIANPHVCPLLGEKAGACLAGTGQAKNQNRFAV